MSDAVYVVPALLRKAAAGGARATRPGRRGDGVCSRSRPQRCGRCTGAEGDARGVTPALSVSAAVPVAEGEHGSLRLDLGVQGRVWLSVGGEDRQRGLAVNTC